MSDRLWYITAGACFAVVAILLVWGGWHLWLAGRARRLLAPDMVVTWYAVDGPKDCRCGHRHFGRVSGPGLPQWHLCEDLACECKILESA